MQLLFAISIVSFCALFWAVLALARHLRSSRVRASQPPAQGPLTEIFEAGEIRAPRSLRLVQKLVQNVAQPRPQLPEAPPPPQSLSPLAPLASSRRAERRKSSPKPALESSITSLTSAASLDGEILRHAAGHPVAPLPFPEAVPVERRKAPQSVRPGLDRRTDWALYNKDLGDLTDPYTQPLGSATAAGSGSLNRS